MVTLIPKNTLCDTSYLLHRESKITLPVTIINSDSIGVNKGNRPSLYRDKKRGAKELWGKDSLLSMVVASSLVRSHSLMDRTANSRHKCWSDQVRSVRR